MQVLQVLQDLAVKAMRDLTAASQDVIFLCGSRATAAYLKRDGALTYYYTNEDEEKQSSVQDLSWISEVCLWAGWVYQGDLVADDVSRSLARCAGRS